MLNKVSTSKTPITIPELCKSIMIFWNKTYKTSPKKETLVCLISQVMHETGAGTHCFNFNLGNVKAHDNPNATIDYMALTGVWEIVNGKNIQVPPTDPGAWFRAFNTLDAGTEFYCHFFTANERYKLAWQALTTGDPTAFVNALHAASYFTDHVDSYLKGVMNYYNKFINDPNINQLFPTSQAVSIINKVFHS